MSGGKASFSPMYAKRGSFPIKKKGNRKEKKYREDGRGQEPKVYTEQIFSDQVSIY